MTALAAFDPGTAIFLVGGYDKKIDLDPFCESLADRAGGVLGIGQTGQSIVDAVSARGTRAQAQFADTIDAAIPIALAWAAKNPALAAVVLSPASASYDQFKNYEQRGDHFVQLAAAAKI
jgi:UDP-N-acetylmuramoylalanine--D-glutamate ligase